MRDALVRGALQLSCMNAPKRQLGLVIAAAIVVANMIGSGVLAAAGKAVASSLVVAMTLLHAFDSRLGGRVQAGFTTTKVLLIAFFVMEQSTLFLAGTTWKGYGGSWSCKNGQPRR